MPEEPTTPDLVELTRRSIEAAFRGDLDAAMRFYAHDTVWDLSAIGMGTFVGAAAIRGFFEEWIGGFDEFEIELEEALDLGNGVVFALIRQNARPVGTVGRVELRYVSVSEWADGLLTRVTNYTDIDEARAADERLAQERG